MEIIQFSKKANLSIREQVEQIISSELLRLGMSSADKQLVLNQMSGFLEEICSFSLVVSDDELPESIAVSLQVFHNRLLMERLCAEIARLPSI